MRALRHFLETHAAAYHDRNRRPEFRTATSRLSPYLHFGQIGPRSVASAVRRWDLPEDAREAWLEQFVIRRELAVNFVARNAEYDRYIGFPEWARKTLEVHAGDPRPHRYTLEEFEAADTHDDLWNAAMREMTHTGFMHGYLRMYWAKKILHWTAGAEEALETAIHLNDRYFLDGRDPNGYTNIAWALGGRHDRPWPEREVFGKIRYMSHASTSRKFDAASYVQQIEELCGRNRP